MAEFSDDIGKIRPQKPHINANVQPSRRKQVQQQQESVQKTSLPGDRIDIAPKTSRDAVDISKSDLKKFTQMLQDMPDVRRDEVDRVKAVLAEDGYGEEALSAVVDQLMEEV